MQPLSLPIIQNHLADLPLGNIEYFPSIGSTNTHAAKMAAANAPDLSLVIADEQTAGRGRSGRTWLTPPASALAFTLVLHLPEETDTAAIPRVAGLGALAVAQALETEFGLSPQIKWPNDVLLNGKKTCGVLAEAHWEGSALQALILGIGINIAPSSIPPTEILTFPATCVQGETDQPVERLKLLHQTIAALIEWKTQITEKAFMLAWEKRLAYIGERVRIATNEANDVIGTVKGLTDHGMLRLEMDSGEEKQFPAGEIHLRPLVDSVPNSDTLNEER